MKKRALVLAFVLLGCLLLACSNGGTSSTGSCTMVDICATFPLATVNMACGQMGTMATPQSVDDSAQTVNNCDYQAGGSGDVAKIYRACDKLGMASTYYNGARTDTPRQGEVRTDVTGVGDKAFWSVGPVGSGNDVELFFLKGSTFGYVRCSGVPTAQVDTVKAAVLPLGTTLASK